MRRGEIWTVAGGPDYAGKPRPAVVVQDDNFDDTASITVCSLTTALSEASLIRLSIVPNERNGLHLPCQIMVDKITTVPKTKIGKQVGRLDDVDIIRLNRAMIVFLGLARPPQSQA